MCEDNFDQKKSLSNFFEKTFVGVAGFEPAASCSQSRRDNRATLHPVSGCKYSNKFLLQKEKEQINKTYFLIVILDLFWLEIFIIKFTFVPSNINKITLCQIQSKKLNA